MLFTRHKAAYRAGEHSIDTRAAEHSVQISSIFDQLANKRLRQLEPMDLDLETVGVRCFIWCRADRDVVANLSHASLGRRVNLG